MKRILILAAVLLLMLGGCKAKKDVPEVEGVTYDTGMGLSLILPEGFTDISDSGFTFMISNQETKKEDEDLIAILANQESYDMLLLAGLDPYAGLKDYTDLVSKSVTAIEEVHEDGDHYTFTFENDKYYYRICTYDLKDRFVIVNIVGPNTSEEAKKFVDEIASKRIYRTEPTVSLMQELSYNGEITFELPYAFNKEEDSIDADVYSYGSTALMVYNELMSDLTDAEGNPAKDAKEAAQNYMRPIGADSTVEARGSYFYSVSKDGGNDQLIAFFPGKDGKANIFYYYYRDTTGKLTDRMLEWLDTVH